VAVLADLGEGRGARESGDIGVGIGAFFTAPGVVGAGDAAMSASVNSRWVRSTRVPALRASMKRVEPRRSRIGLPPLVGAPERSRARNQRQTGMPEP